MRSIITAALLIIASLGGATLASAQVVGIVNPSQVTWTAPTTSADTTPLIDLQGYNLRVAGPMIVGAVCPAFTPTAYPVKGTKPSAVKNPTINRLESFGTVGSKNVAGDLGLVADGQYCMAVSAVDDALNEGAASGTVPFSRNVVAPNAPSGTTVVQ